MMLDKWIAPRSVKEAVHRAAESTSKNTEERQMTSESRKWLIKTLMEVADDASQAGEPEISRKIVKVVNMLSPDAVPPPGAVVSWCYRPVEFYNNWRLGLVTDDGTNIVTDSLDCVRIDEVAWELKLSPEE